jgi:hypothetical protein
MITVKSLRQSGVKVRINHRRRYFDPVNNRWTFLTKYERSLSQLPDYVKMHEKGGITEVTVTIHNRSGNKDFKSVAECSKKEAYNRHRGVEIAIGRILNNVNQSNISLAVS